MAPYNNSNGSKRLENREGCLPSAFTNIKDVQAKTNVDEQKIFVNVMGLVKDFQKPIPTRGKDYKSAITIYDKSIEDDAYNNGLTINVFAPEDKMPTPGVGDVLIIQSAKVQLHRDCISLLHNRTTSIHIYSASKIPRPPQSAKVALRLPYGNRQLGDKEHEYVSWLYHNTNKNGLPAPQTYQERVERSGNIKDKFCKLESVIDGQYCDVIVNVVKAPFDTAHNTTLWVSDYTENEHFYQFSLDDVKGLGGSFGSYDSNIQATGKWTGPFGRLSMQVTCFEHHASQVNADVQLDQWIRIRNLRIKTGRNDKNLEGVVGAGGDVERKVDILTVQEDCDPRLKAAVRRKTEYMKRKREQLKSLAESACGEATSTKKKSDAMNSKARRKQEREAARKKEEEKEKEAERRRGLNELIKCESTEQPVTPISSMLEPVYYKIEEATLKLPFTCAKYRTEVRVVDFRPRKLEDFALWRQNMESDVLSDYSSDSDDNDNYNTQGGNSEKGIWEWRFALQLEGADSKSKGEKERLWVVVDNIEAQQLTGLDASDLRKDTDTLNTLREQLFKLWGNLEESKLQEEQHLLETQRRVAAKQPPPSSPVTNPDPKTSTNGKEDKHENRSMLSNIPFACCIRQYGVRVREPDPLRADAGKGRRWERVFGLFGTKIERPIMSE